MDIAEARQRDFTEARQRDFTEARQRDFAEARQRMVDGQLRPNKVTDPLLLQAMRSIPREAFLPAALQSRAYVDEDVPLPGGQGRVMTEPMVLARLVQLAAIREADRVLLLSAGTGYAAAVLVGIGARVTAVEEDPALLGVARKALAGLGLPPGALRLEAGRVVEGFPAAAPYDAILIEGAVPAVPEALAAQLAEGGRLVTVLGGHAVLGRKLGGAFGLTPAFDCATAALPAFAPAPGFVF
jgi:protein-L-isoaspartate(D-aspartate) O-methyltransferase